MEPSKVAEAIEACDWSGCSIGNKYILRLAAKVLRECEAEIANLKKPAFVHPFLWNDENAE